MSTKHTNDFVTNRELASELRAMRWEMRALIACAAVANVGLLYGLKIPPVPAAVHFVVGFFT